MAAAKGPDGLTDKQRAYADGRARGKSKTDAYMDAYETKGTRKQAYRQARELETDPGTGRTLSAYIERLRKQYAAGQVLQGREISAALSEIASDHTALRGDRLRALDLLNRMQGAYIDRREVTLSASVSMETAEEAAKRALEAFSPGE